MSPSGSEAFTRKAQAKEARAAQYGGDRIKADYFNISANQYAIVRILEQGDEITFADVHRVPVEGRRYPVDFICLDTNDDGTPCPACQTDQEGIRKRATKGFFNVIWREGPVYKRNEYGTPEKGQDGKPVITGRADGVFLWKCSWTVLNDLMAKDSTYKGLMSRDLRVMRTGSTMQDTKYTVEPADIDAGPQPMLIPDLALAEKKYDLRELTKPLGYAELAQILNSGTLPNGPQPTMDRSAVMPQTPTQENVFSGGAPQRASAFQRG